MWIQRVYLIPTPVWVGRQTGGIPLVKYNPCKVSVFRRQSFPTPMGFPLQITTIFSSNYNHCLFKVQPLRLQSPLIVVHSWELATEIFIYPSLDCNSLSNLGKYKPPRLHFTLLASSITHKYWRFEEEFVKLFRIFTTSLTITTALRPPKLYVSIFYTSSLTLLKINLVYSIIY